MQSGILVTRPMPQAEATAARLAGMGYAPILSPMLRYEMSDPLPASDLTDVQAVLLTSIHGARALSQATTERAIPLLTVGDRTAEIAADLGFTRVTSAQGDAADLAQLASKLSPGDGAILHVRGAHVSRSPLERLENFETREAVLYQAVQASRLPDEADEAFAQGRVSAVLIYSARTAEALATCISKESARDLALIGLSPAAIAPLEHHSFLSRHTAPKPTESALLQALTQVLPVA